MPKLRLPWFKVWVGATRHEKVVTLDDRSFRAWVELLDAASEQPTRGRFSSYTAAAAIIRRPVAVVRHLGAVHLLDERPDGVWLHDWPEWQRWRPEDDPANGPRITHESLRNGNGLAHESHTIDSDTPTESLPNRSPSTQESHVIDDPPRVERAKTEKEKKTKTKSTPPSTTSMAPPGGAAAADLSDEEKGRVNEIAGVLAPFGISNDVRLWRKVLDTYGDLDLTAEALKQSDWLRRHRMKTCSSARYLAWLSHARNDRPGNNNDEVVAEDEPRAMPINEEPVPPPKCWQCGAPDTVWCARCREQSKKQREAVRVTGKLS